MRQAMVMKKYALISVYDKTDIAEFSKELVNMNWSILSSGGTAKGLFDANIPVKDITDLVGPPILGHRVVTLSRELHAGLLADMSNPEQMKEMEKLGLPIINMVVCDFYPLKEAIGKPGATVQSVIEMTDIGGPAMVRSAAKGGRIVICRFEDRQTILDELKLNGNIDPITRRKMRARAEFEVAKYCLASAKFHSGGVLDEYQIINEDLVSKTPQEK